MFKAQPLPEQKYLVSMFDYQSGGLVWKQRPRDHFATKNAWSTWNSRFAGSLCGSMTKKGYIDVSIDGRLYKAHRIIWVMHFGSIPVGMQIDHINHVKHDNRIENLRLVKPATNQKNRPLYKNNSSGVNGVYWNKINKKWDVYIGHGGKLKRIGSFSCKEKAVSARALADREAGFHSNHGKAFCEVNSLRKEFTYLFLGTPSDKPNTTPVVLRVEANTEQQARSHFLNWNLVFAAQIRTKAPCRLQLMDGGDHFTWIFEQRFDACTSGVQEVVHV
ncbi:host cell division inhibitor Icd-like protein [Salmonella enterica]|nr:HNH endonuclease [Salmonella enterica]